MGRASFLPIMSESEADLTGQSLLLHVCCGPCAVWPIQRLLTRYPGLKLALWFYNPNIQPIAEFRRRRDGLAFLVSQLYGADWPFKVDFSPPYESAKFLAQAAKTPNPPERCLGCYELRLKAAALAAKTLGYSHFSTTLLYSRQQKHDLIALAGRKAQELGVQFYYEDFRVGWKEGRAMARSYGLYRQTTCGCVYEDLERS
jgi:predicted adenine nucleotide alpha hydrolase (AANH) superfamily ATPase